MKKLCAALFVAAAVVHPAAARDHTEVDLFKFEGAIDELWMLPLKVAAVEKCGLRSPDWADELLSLAADEETRLMALGDFSPSDLKFLQKAKAGETKIMHQVVMGTPFTDCAMLASYGALKIMDNDLVRLQVGE